MVSMEKQEDQSQTVLVTLCDEYTWASLGLGGVCCRLAVCRRSSAKPGVLMGTHRGKELPEAAVGKDGI